MKKVVDILAVIAFVSFVVSGAFAVADGNMELALAYFCASAWALMFRMKHTWADA